MKLDTSKKLSDIITEMMREDGTAKMLLEREAEGLWRQIMGPTVMNATSSVRVNKGVMYVGLTSSVVRNELYHMKGMIMSAINKAVGEEAVRDIRFM